MSENTTVSFDSFEDRNKRVHRAIQDLRVYEAAIAANSKAAQKARERKKETYAQYLLIELGRYWEFIAKMWGMAIRRFVQLL